MKRLRANSDQNYLPLFGSPDQPLVKGLRDSGTLKNCRRSMASGGRTNFLEHPGIFWMKDLIRTQLPGRISSRRIGFGNENGPNPIPPQNKEERKPDRASTEYEDRLPLERPGLSNGMKGSGQGIREGGMRKRHRVRHRDRHPPRHRESFRVSARNRPQPDGPAMRAKMLISSDAGHTGSAPDGADNYSVPHLPFQDANSQPLDGPTALMAHDRSVGKFPAPVEMQV